MDGNYAEIICLNDNCEKLPCSHMNFWKMCKFCQKLIATSDFENHHLANHKDQSTNNVSELFGSTVVCEICTIPFPKEDLSAHMASAHKDSTEIEPNETIIDTVNTKKHQCNQCEEGFEYFRTLWEHKQKVHNIKAFSACEKTFHSALELSKHSKSSHETIKITNVSALDFENEHLLPNQSGTFYECLNPAKNSMNMQINLCELCDKNFSNQDYLIHLIVSHHYYELIRFLFHDKIKVLIAFDNFVCPACQKLCPSKKYLIIHYFTHHDEEKLIMDHEKEVYSLDTKCEACFGKHDIKRYRKHEFIEHITKEHPSIMDCLKKVSFPWLCGGNEWSCKTSILFPDLETASLHLVRTHSDEIGAAIGSVIQEERNRISMQAEKDKAKKLMCEICDDGDGALYNETEFNQHLANNHFSKAVDNLRKISYPFRCKCNAELQDFQSSLIHMQDEHRLFQDLYDKAIRSKIQESFSDNESAENIKCNVCHKTFESQDIMKFHIKAEHMNPNKRFKCQICVKKFETKILQNEHLIVRHVFPKLPMIKDNDLVPFAVFNPKILKSNFWICIAIARNSLLELENEENLQLNEILQNTIQTGKDLQTKFNLLLDVLEEPKTVECFVIKYYGSAQNKKTIETIDIDGIEKESNYGPKCPDKQCQEGPFASVEDILEHISNKHPGAMNKHIAKSGYVKHPDKFQDEPAGINDENEPNENDQGIAADISKQIEALKPKVDKTEAFVANIRKCLTKAYALWNKAETSKSYSDYETFFNYAIKKVNIGTANTSILLYKNDIKESSCLIYYIVMALVHMKELNEAYGKLKFWILNFKKDNIVQQKIDDLQVDQWLSLDNANPKENFLQELDEDHMPGSETGYMFACLVAIKFEIILDMRNRLKDFKKFLDAYYEQDQKVIDEMRIAYPEIISANFCEFSIAILEGKDQKSYKNDLAEQIDHLKGYISMCYDKNPEKGLHPKFVEDVLDFDSRFTKDIIDSHLKEEISYQLHEFASLRSVWSYFEKLFNNSDMKVEKDLIQSILRQLAKNYDFELPTKVRNFPIKCNPRPNLNQSNPSKRSRTDSNSLIPSKRLAL